MQRRMSAKWRPPLLLVLGGSLAAVLVLPVAGLLVADALAAHWGRDAAVALVVLGVLLVTLILGWLLWRLILAPVQSLAAAARAIRDGRPADPPRRYGTPEIGELGAAVLEMADVLTARELAVRSYADHVTHELRTPLTAIRGAAELLQDETGLSESGRAMTGAILAAEARAEKLLAAARTIASSRAPVHRGTTTLREALPAGPEGLEVRTEGDDVAVPLARDGLGIVLTHLMQNARDAGADRITFAAGRDAGTTVLVASDNGPGISAGNRERIFEPFFTTRRDSGGTGMGLSIVQTLMLAHGGEITLEDEAPGAAFRLRFQATDKSA